MDELTQPPPAPAPHRHFPRDLNVFALPEHILASLRPVTGALTGLTIPDQADPADLADQADPADPLLPIPESPQPSDPADPTDLAPGPKHPRCSSCHTAFAAPAELRSHVRSDWHRYNLRLRLRGAAPVPEDAFDARIGDLAESISGSGSGSDSDADRSRHRSRSQSRSRNHSRSQSQTRPNPHPDNHARPPPKKSALEQAPLIWFRSPESPDPNTLLGVYKALFSPNQLDTDPASLPALVKAIQTGPYRGPAATKKTDPATPTIPAGSGPTYFLCMLGGGHFSAAIVAAAPRLSKNGKTKQPEHSPVLLAHKSFHRYTTRRKQGGAQSANDAAKGAAHSAGSNLRRYNEAALETEIRDLLHAWRGPIAAADGLFLRIGRTRWSSLFGPDGDAVVDKADPRIRKFPFSTRRATQAELLRAWSLLSRVVLTKAPPPPAQNREKEREKEPKEEPAHHRPAEPALTEDEQAHVMHSNQLLSLIKRSKAPAVLTYLEKNGLDGSTFSVLLTSDVEAKTLARNERTPTLLHVAAAHGAGAVVISLLTRAGADPTVPNGDGRTAFQLCPDEHTRDAFRIGRAELGEARWGWPASHVPAPLLRADVDARRAERDRAAQEQRDAEQARAADRERERREQAERDAARGFADRAGLTAGPELWRAESRGLDPDARKRLELERLRAARLAAIARRRG